MRKIYMAAAVAGPDPMNIDDIFDGANEIAVAYNALFGQGRNLDPRLRLPLETMAVFTAAQYCGIKGIDITETQLVKCGDNDDREIYAPALKALGRAQGADPNFFGAVGGANFGDSSTMYDQIQSYYCASQVQPENEAAMTGYAQTLTEVAMTGYAYGQSQVSQQVQAGADMVPAAVAATYAGVQNCYPRGDIGPVGDRGQKRTDAQLTSVKKKQQRRGGRGRKVMKGGMDQETKKKLLTVALIGGAGVGAYLSGGLGAAAGAANAGIQYCWGMCRRLLYSVHLLKPPCVSDAQIIGRMLVSYIPGIGAGTKSCADIAMWNKTMSLAIMSSFTGVYAYMLKLGYTPVTVKQAIAAPGNAFDAINTNISEPLLTRMEAAGAKGKEYTVSAITTAAGAGGAALLAMRNYVSGSCARRGGDDAVVEENAVVASAQVQAAATEAAAIGQAVQDGKDPVPVQNDGDVRAQPTDEQQAALDAIRMKMDDAQRRAFTAAIKLCVAKARANAIEDADSDEAKKAIIDSLPDDASKKLVFEQMNEAQQEIIKGILTVAVFDGIMAGGRRRRTRKRGHKKKRKTVRRKSRAKKTKAKKAKRKPKRKTHGRKAKGKRGTRKYKR